MKRSKILKIVLCVVIATIGLMFGACSHNPPQYEQLSAPQNLRVEDGVLVWDEVEHASGYAVYIENDEHLTTEPKLDLSELTESNTVYELFIIAVGDGKRYSDSNEVKYSYAYKEPEVIPTPNLKYTLLNDGSGYEVSRGNANLEGRIVIPDYYEGLPVKRIAQEAFGKDGLNLPTNALTTGVRLPNTLEEIGKMAFIRCIKLAEVEIPDSVVTLGENAFYSCKALTKVKLPASLYELPSYAFSGCLKLEEMPLPSSLRKIGVDALSSTNLSSIIIPDGVTEIGAGAFINCPITEITIPDGVTRLEDEILRGCSSLADIRFPKKIEFFGRSAVRGTKWLNDQPDGVVTLQGYMCGFNGTIPNGSELTIPPEVKHIVGDVFYYCDAEDITLIIPDGITLGSGAFARFKGLKSIRLPADLKCIPDYAFHRCTSLESIQIPDEVLEIGDYAFNNCNALFSLELPFKLKTIGYEALSCKNITMLHIPDSVTELGSMANDYIRQIIMSPTLAATAPRLPLNGYKSVYITCTPEENEYNYEELFKGQNIARIKFYLYVEDEQDLPDDGGNYWHYDEDGKTPVIWQAQSNE